MARYKHSDVAAGQGLFLSVNLQEQLLFGSFEYMLNEIIGTKIDLSGFDRKYTNDFTGASAVPPSSLLKLIFYGYYKGSKSSRKIYELNNNNIIAKALTGDMRIHWTTIADFISGSKEAVEETFTQVLMYCNELGLIGGENFAVDGLRLPSNALLSLHPFLLVYLSAHAALYAWMPFSGMWQGAWLAAPWFRSSLVMRLREGAIHPPQSFLRL